MTLPIDGIEYEINTFLDMQKDLADYLSEAYNVNGTWSIAEKKRRINQGCVAVATEIMEPRTFLEKKISGSSGTPFFEIPAPSDLLKPGRLFIDGIEYMELSMENFMLRTSSGAGVGPELAHHYYWHDTAKRILNIRPKLTLDNKDFCFYYVKMPKKLVQDGDVSDINPAFSDLPALWAAWRMLYRDEEHADRGRSARQDFMDRLDDYNKFRNRSIGSKQPKMVLDSSLFPARSHEFVEDTGDLWDRLP